MILLMMIRITMGSKILKTTMMTMMELLIIKTVIRMEMVFQMIKMKTKMKVKVLTTLRKNSNLEKNLM